MNGKKNIIIIIFFLVVVFTFSCSFINNNISFNKNFELNCKGDNSFQTSDNEISIITPESKTYTEPMSGYYPATYGFENDEIWIIPEEWSFFTSYTGFVQVVEEMDGHNKVVELKDAGGGGGATIVSNTFSSQTTGIIECYIYLDYPHNSGDYLMIQIHDQNPQDTIVIYWEDGNLVVYNGAAPTTVGSYNGYTWYHVRIQFDCADDWHLWIDENSVDGGSGYGFRSTTTTSITKFDMRTWSDNVFNYIDAVGYSWDPNYNIGDNLNEGLLLSFVNRTPLDWMGYSLDGLTTKTIVGNTTLPLPTNGVHNIQVFGNDSLGTIYASEIQYFSINAPPPYIPPDNSFIIIISVAVGALSIFLGVLLILYVILSRNRKYEPHKFKEPKKPEIRAKPKHGYLICPYCHNENDIKNNYCMYCGSSLLEFKPDNM